MKMMKKKRNYIVLAEHVEVKCECMWFITSFFLSVLWAKFLSRHEFAVHVCAAVLIALDTTAIRCSLSQKSVWDNVNAGIAHACHFHAHSHTYTDTLLRICLYAAFGIARPKHADNGTKCFILASVLILPLSILRTAHTEWTAFVSFIQADVWIFYRLMYLPI